ncbi:thymidylate synthase-like [Gordionus sp. m RMFG-2023]|uniref:thymidylate synthase-like n=1 Tax=Gordionus sp. m RMFG-2023 TaxID=3053472 RepID=UPI0031FDBA27
MQSRYSLKDYALPMFTTKKMFLKGILHELLWFINGCTDSHILKAKGVNIWNANASKEYLDSIGLADREEGDLGPVYGFQWRHYGAKYYNKHSDYSGQGFDQLANIIETLKINPDDRRMIMSAWNPLDIPKMALPPCHLMSQFYVANGELSCLFYQRSADMGLGVPFNVTSYSILTHMIAHITNLKPGELIHTIGDAHVYINHIKPLEEQISREPYAFPKLKINRQVENIDDFKFEDFEVVGYKCHSKIAMDMAV